MKSERIAAATGKVIGQCFRLTLFILILARMVPTEAAEIACVGNSITW